MPPLICVGEVCAALRFELLLNEIAFLQYSVSHNVVVRDVVIDLKEVCIQKYNNEDGDARSQ